MEERGRLEVHRGARPSGGRVKAILSRFTFTRRDDLSKKEILGTAMSVGALIRALESCDQDAPVLALSDYGDHAHTERALPVESADEVPGVQLYGSAYSQSGLAFRLGDDGAGPFSEPDEDDEDDGCELVVVLNLPPT